MLSSPYRNQLSRQTLPNNEGIVRGTQEANSQKTSNNTEMNKSSTSDINKLNNSETNPSNKANALISKGPSETQKLTSDAKNPKYTQDASIPETNVPDASPQAISGIDDQGAKSINPSITQPPPVNSPEKSAGMNKLVSKSSERSMPQDTSEGPRKTESTSIDDAPSQKTNPANTPPDSRPKPRQPFHRTPEIDTPSPSGPSISTPKISSPKLAGPPKMRMPQLRIPKLR